MVYGLELMANAGIYPTLMKAGKANMYLSQIFTEAIVNSSGIPVELVETDGALGAALGAGVGADIFSSPEEATANLKKIDTIIPNIQHQNIYQDAYENWKQALG
jgi:xylulokinase